MLETVYYQEVFIFYQQILSCYTYFSYAKHHIPITNFETDQNCNFEINIMTDSMHDQLFF